MKEWCLGFVILPHHVVLLKKSNTMHIGLWNGLGGKIERGEPSQYAMRREAIEEAGLDLTWHYAGHLDGKNDGEPWRVDLYGADGVGKVDNIAEVTASYAGRALADRAYRVPYDELSGLPLAPHTKVLMHVAQDKICYPDTRPIQLVIL